MIYRDRSPELYVILVICLIVIAMTSDGRHGVSNLRQLDRLIIKYLHGANIIKKNIKALHYCPCENNPPVTGELPSERISNP